ncbi:MAG: electron transfer flavoprotein subunit alpha/FixB family protein [Christensenellales bacterium]|jgi:electron transfer flavoprotein alpha subunit
MSFDTKDIFVFIEQRNGVIAEGSRQLLAKSRELVKEIPSFDVVGVLLGHEVQGLADKVFTSGADKVILVDSPRLGRYNTQHYAAALTSVCNEFKPDTVLLAATVIGRDLAPRVAARLNTGLTADATQIEVDTTSEHPGMLLVTRPAFGGNLFGTIICPRTRPQMSTIRPHVFDELKEAYAGRRELVQHHVTFEEKDQVRFIRQIPKKEKSIDISKANVILSGGRGMKDAYDLVVKTAQSIGATPGSSRALVDAGIAPKPLQVGQTGTTVKPKVYIAVGISGAVQHTAGMDKSDLIIAVNSDPKAAIFNVAHVGLVADGHKVLPLIKEELLKAAEKK